MKDLWRLLLLFRPYWGWLALGTLLSFVTVLANVGLLATAAWFITAMAMAGVTGISMNYFTPAALIRGLAIVRTVGRYVERLVTHEATLRVLSELRVWFYTRLEPLAPAGLENYRSGDLLSRIRADIDTLDKVYLRLLVPAVVALLSSAVFIVLLLAYRPSLALLEAALLMLAGLVLPWLMDRFGHAPGGRLVEQAAELRSTLVSDLRGMGELLVAGAADRHAEQVDRISGSLASTQRTMNALQGSATAAIGLCANLAMWAMIVLATPLVASGDIAPADLTMLALFALASFEAVAPLPMAFQTLGESLAAARRIFSIADAGPGISEPAQPLELPTEMMFELQQVEFRYPGANRDALKRIDFTFRAGQCWAVLGESGSGKSTLANLLLRFREPSGGRILLGGRDLDRYESEALRQHISVASQQVHLFNTTIRENLLLARPDASFESLVSACRSALVDEFIQQQPDGYDTVIGETGVRLSGGQARRLSVARALLKEAPVLILDEPTEGLDPEMAAQLMKNVLEHARARRMGLLLITHRIEGLESMDGILMLDRGYVVETGSHAELIARQGRYHAVRASRLCEDYRSSM